jgi:hypothetical protein
VPDTIAGLIAGTFRSHKARPQQATEAHPGAAAARHDLAAMLQMFASRWQAVPGGKEPLQTPPGGGPAR